jgi:hypothetical protein
MRPTATGQEQNQQAFAERVLVASQPSAPKQLGQENVRPTNPLLGNTAVRGSRLTRWQARRPVHHLPCPHQTPRLTLPL